LQELEVAPNGGDWAILLRQQQHRRGKGLGNGMFSGGILEEGSHTQLLRNGMFMLLSPKSKRKSLFDLF
jgi:hypothetical protein